MTERILVDARGLSCPQPVLETKRASEAHPGNPLEVLRQIKEAPGEVGRLPVVILTTSQGETDLARAYDHHANSYLVKPLDFPRFTDLMRDLGYYWLVWNRRPQEKG